MRKSSSRSLDSTGSRLRRYQSDTINPSAARNSKRVGNPIEIPGNPPRDTAIHNTIAKMKTSRDSSQGVSSGITSTRKSRRDLAKNIPHTRSSTRVLNNKRKAAEDVIEIDSDEDTFQSAEEELTPKRPIRSRRLIQPDKNSDNEEEDEFQLGKFNPTEIKKITQPSDRLCQRVTDRLIKTRKELDQSKSSQERRRDAKEKEKREEIEKDVSELIKREREEAIIRERERAKVKLLAETLRKTDPSKTTKEDLYIPTKRQKLFASPNPFIEKNPVSISLTESASKTSAYFNLPTTTTTPTEQEPAPSSLDKVYNLVRTARNKVWGPSRYSQPEKSIGSQPIIGDIFSFEDFDKADPPPTPKLTTPKVSIPKLSKPKQEEPIVKTELPHDPIDDEQLQPIGSDSHLLTFPFEGKKSVTVYERDLSRLEEEQYLNDTLLDVFPKIWEDDYPSSSTHTFSSFFYTKLAGDGSTVNYDKIGRWTANINIFEKRTIIIPVAQYHHWYLIVVTNPSRCIRNTKVYGLLNEDESDNDDFIEEDRPPRVGRWKNQVPAGARLNPKKAYIMVLDSLAGTKKETCTNISDYLKKEAMHKLNIQEDEFIEPEFVQAHCPNQKNFVDCGVFCLHFINSLYKDSDRMMKVLYDHQRDDKGWDLENTLPVYRQVLKRMLKKKMVKYREYLLGKFNQEGSMV